MPEQLQALLNTIQEEGFRKADQEREKVLAEARAEAKQLVDTARDEAAKLVADAKQEAAAFDAKGRESLRQAARDTLLSLRTQLNDRMAQVVRSGAAETLDVKTMGEILTILVKGFAESGGKEARFEALVSEGQAKTLEQEMRRRLSKHMRDAVTVTPLPDIEAGFQLRMEGDQATYDFTDAALAEVLCRFLNPRLGELVVAASE